MSSLLEKLETQGPQGPQKRRGIFPLVVDSGTKSARGSVVSVVPVVALGESAASVAGESAALTSRIAPPRDAFQPRNLRPQLAPDPARQVLEAGLREAVDVVQHPMVEA